jgi:hypothetical protein
MSEYVESASNISQGWLKTLEYVHDRGGRCVNVLTTIADPSMPEDDDIRAVIDKVLGSDEYSGGPAQGVDTVASTIFPHDLYFDPGLPWSPDLSPEDAARLDTAAMDLYQMYGDMLPLLCTARANNRGTYFGRMISWPGKEAGGTNQLAERVKYLRKAQQQGHQAQNVSDIAVGGEAELLTDLSDLQDVGLQVYAPTDRRTRGFPCLVHIDFTLLEGRLSMLAVYRHQYLITKAYGNLVGLSRLLVFLAQQTGFEVGELAVLATLADTQPTEFGGRRGIEAIVRAAR